MNLLLAEETADKYSYTISELREHGNKDRALAKAKYLVIRELFFTGEFSRSQLAAIFGYEDVASISYAL